MTSEEIRRKYLEFFKASPRNHQEIDPAPLVLEGDPTTLFTSAGMQPLIPYLKGEPHPKGKRLVNSQPSLRLQDIEEVGDASHTTFFEMLGNWSLGDYFKKEQLAWCWEFFTKELRLDAKRLSVSVFEGTEDVPKDTQSAETWKKIGVPEERICYYGVDKNWWSRSGTPESMPEGEIGGPDSEVFYEFTEVDHDKKYGEKCHPNCPCGRFMEIGNSVFIEFEKQKDGTLSELPQKNVDFGGGLERIVAAVDNRPDIFKIDIYRPVTAILSEKTGKDYLGNEEAFRIIADHLRASVAIASEGIYPSNKLQGYVLRRLIRRAVTKLRELDPEETAAIEEVVEEFKGGKNAKEVILEEVAKFEKVLSEGRHLVEQNPKIDPFELYQSFGIPFEVSVQLFSQAGRKLGPAEKKAFEEKLKEHQEKSRGASAGMFKGGLADTSEEVVKLHTATHLIHAALRKVLGGHVAQKGSNITAERLRFDFSHPQKLTDPELKEVEALVNEQVKKNLPVTFETKTLEEAISEGALHFFGERYGKEVKVYSIGDFSKEVCGGPHVNRTGELKRVRIIKQEKLGSGVVRIYAKVTPE